MPRLIDHDERRRQLAEATWRVIMRDGVGRASVRSVATESGHSAGSLRHLFPTQSELLVYALQLVIDRATARIAALPPRPTAVETVIDVAAQFLPLDSTRRSEMEVYQALFNAADTAPHLRGPRDDAHHQVQQACRWMIEQLDNGTDLAGSADRDLEAARLHALIDGLAAHLVYEPADADTDWANKVLISHIHSLTNKSS